MRRGCMMLGLLAPLLLAGCRKEEPITRYKVTRLEDPEKRAEAPAMKKGPARLLGAILSNKETMWFMRLNGPEEKITPLEKDFEGWVQSIRFPAGAEPIAWTLPKGWIQLPGDGKFRYATIRAGGGAGPELVVSPLPREANEGLLKGNLDRWRNNYLGLPPLKDGEEGKYIRTIEVEGTKVLLVDMKGPTAGKGMKDPHEHLHGELPGIHELTKLPFKADLPPNWRAIAGKERGRILIDGGKKGAIQLSRLKGEGPDWLAVLEEMAPGAKVPRDKVLAGQGQLELDGKKVPSVEFSVAGNIEDEKLESKIFGAQYPVGKDTWGFILVCPPESFEATKKDLLTFLRSVRPEEPKADLPKGDMP